MRSVRIGDIMELRRRRVHVEPLANYEEVGIRSFGRGIFHKESVSGSHLGNKRIFEIQPGDLVISNVFAWEGAIAVAGSDEAGKVGSHRFMTFEVDPLQANASYLRYYLLTEQGLTKIRGVSPGSAGRNRTLGIEAFLGIKIPLPRREVQAEVATALERIDSAVRDAESRSELRDALLPAARNAAFRDLANDLPQAPIGQVVERVRTPVDVAPFQEYSKLGIRSFGRGVIRYPPTEGQELGKLRFFKVVPNALIVSNIKAWEGAVAVTSDEHGDCVASNRFHMYVPTDRTMSVEFIRHFLLSDSGLLQLQQASPGSADRNRTLGVKAFEAMTVPLAPADEQARIVNLLTEIDEASERIRERHAMLDALLPSAMHALIPN